MNIEDRITDLNYMTGVINMMARQGDLDFCYTEHCLIRMRERNITVPDILFILKTGMITQYQGKAQYDQGCKIHKYKITGVYLGDEQTNREISLVILVEVNRFKNPAIKIQEIITSMWED